MAVMFGYECYVSNCTTKVRIIKQQTANAQDSSLVHIGEGCSSSELFIVQHGIKKTEVLLTGCIPFSYLHSQNDLWGRHPLQTSKSKGHCLLATPADGKND